MRDGIPDLLQQGLPRSRTGTREGRIALLAEVFEALLANKLPSREAALFVGGAGSAWLQHGGNLTKTYLRVVGRRGSHATPAAVLRAHRNERQVDSERDIFEIASTDSED